MAVDAHPSESAWLLPVGDPRRPAVGRAAFGTLLTAAVFFVFTVPTKQFAPLYDHAPWENDPFDTVYSLAMFSVPFVAAGFLVQLSLCRKSEPLAIGRVLSILRACRIAVGLVVLTLVSCWLSVGTEANRTRWTSGATVILVALLVLVTGVTGRAIVQLFRAPRLRAPGRAEAPLSTDWLDDMLAVAARESHRSGPLRPAVLHLVNWLDQKLMSRMRHHPLFGAAIPSVVFGLGVGFSQAIREGYSLSATLLTVDLLSCGTFAFLVVAGSYLGIVRSGNRLYGVRRRGVDAGVSACIAAVVALAFRNSLWWVVGSNPSTAGTTQFTELIGLAMLGAFVVVLVVESLRRSHSTPV